MTFSKIIFFSLLVFVSTTIHAETNSKEQVEITVSVTESNQVSKNKVDVFEKIGEEANNYSEKLPSWLKIKILNIEFWHIILSFFFILLGFILKKINNTIFKHYEFDSSDKSVYAFGKTIVSAVGKPLGYFWLLIGIALSISILPLPTEPNIKKFAFNVLKMSFSGTFIWFSFRLIDILSLHFASYAKYTDSKLDDQLVPLLRKTLKTVVSIIIFLWMMQLMGYKVSALLAGLGIGGLAVALALQDTLANLFASIIILLDQPFRVGDRIVVENTDGVVEEIGLRSTRIRTLSKTLVSIPNKIVAGTTIDNIDKMPKRKVSQVIGITYETTASQMEQALSELKKIISDDKGIDKDFFVVRFTDFGDSSLNIEIIYFTVTVDYDAHLAVKEKINLAIMRKIEELGLSMAFPSRTVYIKKDD